jgi:hypothetical protein
MATNHFGRGFSRRLRRLGFTSYAAYLRSDHWAEFRSAYRASNKPQFCIACYRKDYQLHHRSYSRIGCELMNDVIPLCSDCHKKVHAWLKDHGTNLQATHFALRKIFKWTKSETRRRFRPFCASRGHGYRWLPKDDGAARVVRAAEEGG